MKWSKLKSLFWTLSGTSAGNPYFSNSNLLTWANMSVRGMVSESRCLERRQKMVLTAGTQIYDLPGDCDTVRRAAYDGDKLNLTGKFDLQIEAPKWDVDTGTPGWYFVDGVNEQIGLYKIPSSSTTTEEAASSGTGFKVAASGTGFVVDTTDASRLPSLDGFLVQEIVALDLEIYFSCTPVDVSGDDDVPDVPTWAQPLVLYSMLRLAFSAQTPMLDVERAAYWGDMYNYGLKRLKKQSFDRLPKDWLLEILSVDGRPKIGRLPDLIVDNS